MFLRREPTPAAVEAFIEAQSALPFTYAAVGATRAPQPPPRYNIDHNRVLLGHGAEAFEKAAAAVREWRMYDFEWCRLYPRRATVAAGTTVAVVVNYHGLWSLNACRVVYVLEEQQGAARRYGFAYGTLPEHAETGEERFSVELRGEDESVWYDLYAFSRPRQLLAKLGYPWSRRLQRRFARESKLAMARAVGQTGADETFKREARSSS